MKICCAIKKCYEKLGKKKIMYWGLFILKIFIFLISLCIAYCFSNILSMISVGDASITKSCLLILAFLYIITLLFRAIYFFMRQDFEKNVRIDLKKDILSRILNTYLVNQKEGKILDSAKATEVIYMDINNVTTLLFLTADLVLNIFSICVTGIILFCNYFFLAFILTFIYLVMAIWAYKYSQILKNANFELRNETDMHFKLIRDILKNTKYICLANSCRSHYDRYVVNLEHVKEETINRDIKAWVLGYVSTILSYGCTILLLGYGVWQLSLNKLILTNFILFLSYSRIYTTGITSLFEECSSLQQISISVDRVFQLVTAYEERKEEKKMEFPQNLNSIEIVNLDFGYGEKKIISNLNKSITEKIILVTGKNGNGKSTFLNLLSGALNPTKGDILYNGISVTNISYQSLYNSLSYLCQGDIVFDMSIRENILSFNGYEAITEEELFEVCRQVGILGDILSLDEKFETPISEIRDFSYGQKKKLLLARACLRPSQIILFDEPLEGLDKQSQTLLIELILKISAQKYIFISTHKPEQFACKKDTILL